MIAHPTVTTTLKELLMRTFRAAALGLLAAAVLSACVPPAAQRPSDHAPAAQHAADLLRQGQFDQAAQAYLTLAEQTSSGSDHYRLLAAEAYRQEGTLDRAAPVLAQIRRDRLVPADAVHYDLLQAELALQRHDVARAMALTTQANLQVPPELSARLLELRARAMAGSNDYWGAARTRVQLDETLSGADRAQNRKQVIELLSKLGADPLKQRAMAMQPGDRMLPWINESLTQLGVAVARPQPSLGQPVGTEVAGPNANVREGYKVPQRIALLLPLSGPLASAGSSVREGFYAAYADAARNNAPRPDVRSYDTGNTPAQTVKAYQQAVSDGAQLVVGPLTRDDVAAVFAQGQLPVPVLALNHPDGQSLPPAGASEFGLLPETEGALAADHMYEDGLHRAYVLASSEDYAQRAASAFKAEFAAKGGTLVSSGAIDPATVNYAAAIRGLGASTYIDSSASTDPSASPPDAGIFISMRPQQARLLMPQLRLARLDLPVFATSHIYGGADDAAADRDLDGVQFSDAPWLFDAQPGLPNHADITALLPAARGTSARLFAFGMDAWNLVPYLDWLHAHPGSYLPGASGQLTADQFGRVRRVLVWAKFQDGLAHPISGSLQLDDVPAQAPPDDGALGPAPASTITPPAAPLPAAASSIHGG
jgi:outer membrane PBP1 activator LpoA protein